MLVDAGWSPVRVTIGSGDTVHQNGRRFTVPKATLVSKLVALTHSGLLSVHGELRDCPALKRELEILRPVVTPSGQESWAAAGVGHDDLLMAAALCAWWCQHHDMGSWSDYERARQRAAAAGFRDTQLEEFVVGVDIGQSADHTAICCMSRIDGPDPRTDRHFDDVDPPQPESETLPPPMDEQLAEQDLQTKLSLRSTISRAGPLALAGSRRPHQRYVDPPQPGSAEWLAIESENNRYGAELNGARPTAEQITEHERNLATIREAHHAV